MFSWIVSGVRCDDPGDSPSENVFEGAHRRRGGRVAFEEREHLRRLRALAGAQDAQAHAQRLCRR